MNKEFTYMLRLDRIAYCANLLDYGEAEFFAEMTLSPEEHRQNVLNSVKLFYDGLEFWKDRLSVRMLMHPPFYIKYRLGLQLYEKHMIKATDAWADMFSHLMHKPLI